MNLYKKLTVFLLLILFQVIHVSGQSNKETIQNLSHYIGIISHFSKNLPQEKVYVHMDNSCYFQGDDIWFKCYLTNSGWHDAGQLSKTMYVELLNPGGEVVDKQILKIESSQCHGSFSLSKLPFYSGYYELRAYTRYMLNFGEEIVFSRTFPVYDKPQKSGDYTEKKLLEYGLGKYPLFRPKPTKDKSVTLKLFPEGGHLVQGISSRIAFEATDAYGLPIDITGEIINEKKETVIRFSSEHDGRGMFSYTPNKIVKEGEECPKIKVVYQNKSYQFDLPKIEPDGVVLKVDNVSSRDSIAVELYCSGTAGDIYGLALLSGSSLQKYMMVDLSAGNPVTFNIGKMDLPAGVTKILLFNSVGQIVADRLIFIHQKEKLKIQQKTDKSTYSPYELVNMQFEVSKNDTTPVETTFSVSIKDKQFDIKPDQDIQSNLLLMSEIKGYVHYPAYYFESDDLIHRRALDQLLMVQGWHRFDWNWVDGKKPFELKYRPEKAIEVNGQVVAFVKSTPKPRVNVSTLLTQKNEGDTVSNSFIENFVTDSLGRFHFAADVEGRWNMIFAVKEGGKTKDYRTILDKLFSPAPKQYRYTDLFAHMLSREVDSPVSNDTINHVVGDSIPKTIPLKTISNATKVKGTQEKMIVLKDLVVRSKKFSKEKDVLEAKSKSLAYYDVYAEQDKLQDKGEIPEQYLNEFLPKTNKEFFVIHAPDSVCKYGNILLYKGRDALLVVDYQRTELEENYKIPQYIRVDYIKSIYVSEDKSSIIAYCDPTLSPMDAIKAYSCVVFIEIMPDWKIPTQAGKGVRKTWLDGYSRVKEFYNPNYSTLPPEQDYRRTLYWNPSVKTDTEGKALIQFYNNGSCRKFSVSAETITPDGIIGVLND